jgi:hypothetical protein
LFKQGKAMSENNTVESRQKWKANHITTATTTVVKTGPGVLHAFTVGTGGASSTATVYDNTAASGTVLAVISTAAQANLVLDIGFSIGLTVVTATGTPADITVSYV